MIIKESDLENESVNAAEMSDIPAYTCRNPHREGIRLVTEYYSIETGILNADIVYASKTRFIARQNAGRNEVHTYDLEKMEHYVTRLNGNDCLTASFDGNFVLSELEDYVTGKEVYYVDPELGVAYLLSQNDIFELHRYGSSVEYYTVEPVEIHFSESGCFNAYKAVSVCSISEKE